MGAKDPQKSYNNDFMWLPFATSLQSLFKLLVSKLLSKGWYTVSMYGHRVQSSLQIAI